MSRHSQNYWQNSQQLYAGVLSTHYARSILLNNVVKCVNVKIFNFAIFALTRFTALNTVFNNLIYVCSQNKP